MKTRYFLIAMLLFAGCIAIRPTARIEFDAPASYPEGIAYDNQRNTFYVSSAHLATVGKVSPEGVYSSLYSDSTLRSTYGMKIHPDGNRLFVCVGDANYSRYSTPDTRYKLARLISIDLQSGRKVDDIDLSGLIQDIRFPNDLTFDQNNNIYITDSYADAVYKVDASGKPSVFSQSPLFKTKGIGVNGIVHHSGGFLLVSASATGALYKVDMANPNNVRKVKMDQVFMNADGLLLNASDTLTLVQNGGVDKIYKMITRDNWESAEMAETTLAADRFTYPSTAALRGTQVWIMNTKFHDLEDSTSIPSKKFAIQHAVFKPIPKRLRKE